MGTCLLCGDKDAYIGALDCECNTVGCQNFKPIDPNSITITFHGTLQGLAPLSPVQYHISPQTKVVTIKYGSGGVIIEPPELAKQWHNNIPTWEGIVTAAEKDGMTHIIVDLNDTNSLIKDGQYTVAKVRTEVENKHGPF